MYAAQPPPLLHSGPEESAAPATDPPPPPPPPRQWWDPRPVRSRQRSGGEGGDLAAGAGRQPCTRHMLGILGEGRADEERGSDDGEG
jgi:hypothetical protein